MIELTRCTVSQAELALLDNNNDASAAVEWIFDNGGKVDVWTEQKSRKQKKEEAEKEKIARPPPPARTFVERGGRGGGRGGAGRGGGRGGFVARGGTRAPTDSKRYTAVPAATETSDDWVSERGGGTVDYQFPVCRRAVRASSNRRRT